MADAHVTATPSAGTSAGRGRKSFRRLVGVDRSGPPPPETLPGAPLRPWTIPNLICFIRLALVPVFVALAVTHDHGTSGWAATVFAVVAAADYLDGMAARVTGQYSRLGAIIDPLVDRLLIGSGLAICYGYDLLPRWALIVLAVREAFVLGLFEVGARRGLVIAINWPGRLGVWPVMSSLFFAMVGQEQVATALLYVGLALVLYSALLYVREGVLQSRGSTRA